MPRYFYLVQLISFILKFSAQFAHKCQQMQNKMIMKTDFRVEHLLNIKLVGFFFSV